MFRNLTIILLITLLVTLLQGCSMFGGPVEVRLMMAGKLNNSLAPCG